MYDVASHLLVSRSEQQELALRAARANRVARITRLRRLDRRVQQATARARLVRLAID